MLSPLLPGDPQQIGPYHLRGRLGAGGMGTVFLGFDEAGTAVAIKTLAHGTTAEVRRRMTREAELLRSVHHPRVAAFIASDTAAPTPWIAMQYIAGPSLADAPTPLASGPLKQLADGLADALAAMHSIGLTHRDIKPHNLILTFEGPVLVDFGIASAADLTALTASGTTIGTPAWMAPEQLTTSAVGPAADVWGWGAVLYYAATGSVPFGDGDIKALAYRIQHSDPEMTHVPGWLQQPIAAALSKLPEQRPTAAQLSSSAVGATARIATPRLTAPVTPLPPGTQQMTQLQPRSRRALYIAAALVLVLGIAAVAFLALPRSHHAAAASGSTPPASTPPANPISVSTAPTTTALSTTPSAPTTKAKPAVINTRTLSGIPVDFNGNLLDGYRVSITYTGGNCNPGSEVTPFGYRCFGGTNGVLDPCFPLASQGDYEVVCSSAPWVTTVTRLVLDSPLQSISGGSPGDPWGLQLEDGSRCGLLGGARDTFQGRIVAYSCGQNLYILDPLGHSGSNLTADTVLISGGAHAGIRRQRVAIEWTGTP